MRLLPLTPALADSVAGWFDDPDTVRYLGDRHWLYRALELVRSAPGSDFRGHRVRARHVWIASEQGAPCALLDVEPYADRTAGFALVVAPDQRGSGVACRALAALAPMPELADTDMLIGAVEPGNLSGRVCFAKAGFAIAWAPDEEGMLRMHKRLRGGGA